MAGTKSKIGDDYWRLRVFVGRSETGSPRFVSKNFRGGVRAADKALAKLVTDVDSGKIRSGAETVSDLLDRFLEHCEATGKSATTMMGYRKIASRTLTPAIGDIKLVKLTASDLDQLYASMTKRGNKATTVRRVHALISAALHQAERWDLVDKNIARRATPPKVQVAQIEVPSPDEVQKIVTVATEIEPMMGALIFMAALTGARRGELCGLRWSDVNWAKQTLTIERSIYDATGGGWQIKSTKTHQGRKVGLGSVGIEVMKRHRVHVKKLAKQLRLEVADDAWMFSRSPQGLEPVRPDALTKFFTRTADKAGVKTHLHALRHFSATQAISAGYDPTTVAARLGHADASITLKVYSHALAQRDADLAEQLGNVLTLPA
jgi:integrase